jgi:glycopeptide antibiotics resistance protein
MILTPVGDGRAASLVPLKDLADVFGDRPSVIVAQLGGNLVVFAAAGFFLPIRTVLFAGLARVGVCAALASATVEIAQYGLAMGRVSSVDDVLLNALGAVIAAALSHRWWARPQVKGQGAGVLGEPEVFVERPGLS